MAGVRGRTEQVGSSATDCAPTRETARKDCRRRKHLIFAELVARYEFSAIVCIGQMEKEVEESRKEARKQGSKQSIDNWKLCKEDAHHGE